MSAAAGVAVPDAGVQVYRASILYFRADPAVDGDAYVWHEDGALVVENGRIRAVGEYAAVKAELLSPSPRPTPTPTPTQLKASPQSVAHGDAPSSSSSPGRSHPQTTSPPPPSWHDYRGKLICPGFIDTHIHFPQTDIIASPAAGLLPWLEKYTFAEEAKFADPEHAAEVARFFLDELLACGTTSAMVYCTVHLASAEAFFTESAARNMRMVAGKVLMDRHAPSGLRDTAESGARDTEALIAAWHGQGRQAVAITPRFAPSSTDAQLRLAGELARAYPDTYVQSHVAESADEVALARSLFPAARSYLDIYERVGLLRERAVYAHCLWLDDEDRARMAATGAAAAICPGSNLFLGSGLFDLGRADAGGMLLSLATDVGGGNSFSMLRTMEALYKVVRLGGNHVSALRMFYLATLGGARAMRLEGTIGTLAPGAEADFIVLDPHATPLLARRTAQASDLEELLFALAMLGDDRVVFATYVAGWLLHARVPH